MKLFPNKGVTIPNSEFSELQIASKKVFKISSGEPTQVLRWKI
jgi:hypothetical protein